MALEVNTVLTHLILSNCGIDDDGMAHISSSLRNKPLQCLNLTKNVFSSEGTKCLCKLNGIISNGVYPANYACIFELHNSMCILLETCQIYKMILYHNNI